MDLIWQQFSNLSIFNMFYTLFSMKNFHLLCIHTYFSFLILIFKRVNFSGFWGPAHGPIWKNCKFEYKISYLYMTASKMCSCFDYKKAYQRFKPCHAATKLWMCTLQCWQLVVCVVAQHSGSFCLILSEKYLIFLNFYKKNIVASALKKLIKMKVRKNKNKNL